MSTALPPPAPVSVYVAAPAQRQTSGFAVASLVLGILWLAGIGSVLAVVFGAIAIRQINQSGGRQSGKGMAVAGLVLGVVFLVLTPILYL